MIGNNIISRLMASFTSNAIRGRDTAGWFSVPTLSWNTSSYNNPWLMCQLSQFDLEVPEKEKYGSPLCHFSRVTFSDYKHTLICRSVSQSHIDLVSLETSLLNSSSKHQPDWKRNSIREKKHLVALGDCLNKSFWNIYFLFPQIQVWGFFLFRCYFLPTSLW